MATGVIISKGGFTIDGATDELYVDPSTELLKVIRNVAGVFSTDGTTWTSKGDGVWTDLGKDGSNRRNFELVIPIPEVDYVCQYLAYMDQKNNDKRMLLSNYLAGVSLEGDVNAFASISMFYGNNKYPSVVIRMSFQVPNQLTAGEYGYFVQIFYNRIQGKNT